MWQDWLSRFFPPAPGETLQAIVPSHEPVQRFGWRPLGLVALTLAGFDNPIDPFNVPIGSMLTGFDNKPWSHDLAILLMPLHVGVMAAGSGG